MSSTIEDLKNQRELSVTNTANAPKKSLALLQKLPPELLEAIFGMLGFQDGKVLYHVNKATKTLVKNKQFEWADGRRLDFLLMMDATQSMGAYLESAKLTLRNIIEKLRQHEKIQKINELDTLEGRKKYHLRTAWLEYRDIMDDVPVKLHPFIENSAKIEAYIANSVATGGSDYPENVSGALEHALQDLRWTTNRYCHAVKVIMLVLDAPPHGMGGTYEDDYPDQLPAPYENTDWIKIAHQMRKQNIIVHTVLCNERCEQLNLFGTTLANITGGKCVFMKNAGDLAEYIVANISADLELEEILAKKLKEIAPKMNENEQEKKKLTERLFQIISEDHSLMVPSSMARTVTHSGASDLARTSSISEARMTGLLQKPKLMSRSETEPMSEKWRPDFFEAPLTLRRSDPLSLTEPKDPSSEKDIPAIISEKEIPAITSKSTEDSLGLSSLTPSPICRTSTMGGSLIFSYRTPSSKRSAHSEVSMIDEPSSSSLTANILENGLPQSISPFPLLPLDSIFEEGEGDEEAADAPESTDLAFDETTDNLGEDLGLALLDDSSLPLLFSPLSTLVPVALVPSIHTTHNISDHMAAPLARSETAPAEVTPRTAAAVSHSDDSKSISSANSSLPPLQSIRRTLTEVISSEALHTRIASMIHQRRAI